MMIRHRRCIVPNCRHHLQLMPLVTVNSAHDQVEGLCRSHLRLVGRDRRRVLRMARLEFRLSPFIAEAILWQRAWGAVKAQAIERAGVRRAA